MTKWGEFKRKMALAASLEEHKRATAPVMEDTAIRVLELSGHYLLTRAITSVCLLPEDKQAGFAGWCRGRIAVQSIKPHNTIPIEGSDSPTAEAIMCDQARQSSDYYYASESRLIPITEDEERAIVAECTAAQEARYTAERAIQAQAATEKNAKFAEAKTTGKRVALRSWMTSECQNGNDSECSFDSATEWAMPDGTVKTTYRCCY